MNLVPFWAESVQLEELWEHDSSGLQYLFTSDVLDFVNLHWDLNWSSAYALIDDIIMDHDYSTFSTRFS